MVFFLINCHKFGDRHQRSLVGKQLKLVGNRDQIIARHRTLLNDLNAFLCRIGDRWTDKFRWNLLRLNENLAFRQIRRRPQIRRADTGRSDQNKRNKEIGPAALEQRPIEGRPKQMASILLQRPENRLRNQLFEASSSNICLSHASKVHTTIADLRHLMIIPSKLRQI